MDLNSIRHLADEFSLDLLVLFGSRVKNRVWAESDWDFGFLPAQGSDPTFHQELELQGRLCQLLRTDAVHVLRLDRAPPSLRKAVADTGQVLFERGPGVFLRFRLLSTKLYWDTAKYRRIQERSLKRRLEELRQHGSG